jgi:anti-sigma factor RsiW
MLCTEFEDRLTDYLDGALVPENHRDCAAHLLSCRDCHALLDEVKLTLQACRTPLDGQPVDLEARILARVAQPAAMSCDEFEQYLTDYLDGFLPAPLFHRWESHAKACTGCADMPGQVVRSIGACYTYINEELAVPVGLHERILTATLGTTEAEAVKAPFGARIAEWLRGLLDPIVSPQFAGVATMLLLAVLVLTNTVSTDGSISGMYRATVRLAERTYSKNANAPIKGVQLPADVEDIPSVMPAVMERDPAASKRKAGAKPDSASEQKSPKER